MPKALSIVILAGGQSSRMGTDKSFVQVGGKPVIERIVGQLDGYGAETILITNKPDDYKYLGLPLFGDLLPGKGPLGGLYTAVTYASQPHAMVVACDMPFVNKRLLDHLVELAPEYDAVVPRLDGETEPFRAVYSRECLGAMRAALDTGKMRVISWFSDVRVRYVEAAEVEQFDPQRLTFFNVNTPDDLARAQVLAAEDAGG